MQIEFLLLMATALGLGFKHSYDADHLVAVSNLLSRSPSLKRTGTMSTVWALGHTITASIIGVVLYIFRDAFMEQLLANLEYLVIGMLVIVGTLGLLWEFNLLHRHPHRHGEAGHNHLHVHAGKHQGHRAMLSIGIVHGVASNDELILLFVLALGVTSLGGLILSVAVFSLGVVVGMVLFGVGLSYPILRWGQSRVRRVVNVAAATLSLAYAGLLVLGHLGLSPLPSL